MTRSPLLIVIAALALVLAAGALVLQFVGPKAGGGVTSAEFSALQKQVAGLSTGGGTLRVASIDLDAVSSVFMQSVSDQMQALETKRTQDSTSIQNAFDSGKINQLQFQRQANTLTAELVDAGVRIYATLLDKMVASSAFASQRTDLTSMRVQVDTVLDKTKTLISLYKAGAAADSDLQIQLSQVQATFTSLQKAVTNYLLAKTLDAVKKIALQRGFDLVLAKSNVIAYGNAATISDITDFVKAEVQGYL